ncbi:hypothetical protein BGX34_000489 [Mortierella sp. NVP85]|nr:hypothetical protein BGX34_000489 [Mortierella sp. NVP85]
MTLFTFFGCALTAYGPCLAIFFGSIAPNAQLVILMVSSRAEQGLNMVAKHPKSKFNRSGYAFSAGLGFGLMFGVISYITLLVQSLGPGVLMCNSCPNMSLYFVSVTHYGASYLTLLNSSTINLGCAYAVLGNVVLLLASAIIVFADLRNLHQKSS